MGNIYQNIGKIHIAVVQDKETRQGELAQALSALAVEAIMSGIGSQAWVSYMSIFADNAAQLTVLTEAAAEEDAYLPRSRAYIVSNAVCAAGTNTATTNGVEMSIAFVVADNTPDGTVQKPSVITELLETLE